MLCRAVLCSVVLLCRAVRIMLVLLLYCSMSPYTCSGHASVDKSKFTCALPASPPPAGTTKPASPPTATAVPYKAPAGRKMMH